MTQVKDIKFEGSNSHHIKFGRQFAIDTEEVYLYFSGTWRGETIRFSQKVSRYTHSQGLSDWRYYVQDAHVVDENGRRVSELSQVARRACDDATQLAVVEWLNTNIAEGRTAYRDSANNALGRAIQRLAGERNEPWGAIREAVGVHHLRLSSDVEGALLDYANAIEATSEANRLVSAVLQQEKADFNAFTWTANGKVDAK